MTSQECNCLGKLIARRVRKQAAIHHRCRGLARIAELDSPQARHADPGQLAQLIRIAFVRPELEHFGTGRLDPGRQRVAQREVVQSLVPGRNGAAA